MSKTWWSKSSFIFLCRFADEVTLRLSLNTMNVSKFSAVHPKQNSVLSQKISEESRAFLCVSTDLSHSWGAWLFLLTNYIKTICWRGSKPVLVWYAHLCHGINNGINTGSKDPTRLQYQRSDPWQIPPLKYVETFSLWSKATTSCLFETQTVQHDVQKILCNTPLKAEGE
jgi:hypothetical protein